MDIGSGAVTASTEALHPTGASETCVKSREENRAKTLRPLSRLEKNKSSVLAESTH